MKRDLYAFRQCSVAEALNHADSDSDDEFFFAALGRGWRQAVRAAPPEVLWLQPLPLPTRQSSWQCHESSVLWMAIAR